MTALTGPAPTVERDRWGRPLIMPLRGTKPVAYTRATTVAKALDDLEGLMTWKQRMTALGLVSRRDLYTAVAATSPDDKTALNRLVKDAADAGGATSAATTGTALHAFTERLDRGMDVGHVPPEHTADLDAYQGLAARTGWEVLDVERFVVDHGRKIAGTADRVLRIGGQTFIADIKSGSSIDFHHAWAVQLAIYAWSLPYDLDKQVTGPWPYPAPSKEWGLVVWLPAGNGMAEARWIDLRAGAEAARTALWVRGWRKRRDLLHPFTGPTPPGSGADPVLEAIATAATVDELTAVWAAHQAVWTDRHTTAAAARKEAVA
ncbi:MAG: PD-(D/E)XK nuclease family protein [Cellulomonas sp.]|jgi:hypothetical protein|nr:PD-(D/E)XK nuclease family protein [Cellulomonas sp.]